MEKDNPPISGLGTTMVLAHLGISEKDIFPKPTPITNNDVLPEDMVRWGNWRKKIQK